MNAYYRKLVWTAVAIVLCVCYFSLMDRYMMKDFGKVARPGFAGSINSSPKGLLLDRASFIVTKKKVVDTEFLESTDLERTMKNTEFLESTDLESRTSTVKEAEFNATIPTTCTEEDDKNLIDSRNMSLEERKEFQQNQVDKFCQAYGNGPSNLTSHMPDRQMLLNNRSKSGFCYVPKSGCSFMKILFFLTLGAISEERFLYRERSPNDEGYLERAIRANSFINKTDAEKATIFKTYTTFVMYRNPVNRLVSGYLSKVDRHPLIGLKPSSPERNWLRLAIYRMTHLEEFRVWKANGANVSIHVEFPDFITYWIQTNGISDDEHFKTTLSLCSLCQNRFTYYGKFEDFENEITIFNDMIQGNDLYLSTLMKNSTQERVLADVASEYYSQIPDDQKRAIVDMLAWDIGLYYMLFPEERGAHRTILGVDYDGQIPVL